MFLIGSDQWPSLTMCDTGCTDDGRRPMAEAYPPTASQLAPVGPVGWDNSSPCSECRIKADCRISRWAQHPRCHVLHIFLSSKTYWEVGDKRVLCKPCRERVSKRENTNQNKPRSLSPKLPRRHKSPVFAGLIKPTDLPLVGNQKSFQARRLNALLRQGRASLLAGIIG